MTIRSHSVFAALFLIFTACAILPAQSPEDRLREMLSVTGITEQMEGVSEMIVSMYASQKEQFGDEAYAAIRKIIGDAFGSTNFNKYILNEFLANYDEAMCSTILNRYKDQLFLDITRAEIAASVPEVEQSVDNFDYSTVDAGRDALFTRYLIVSGSSELEEQIVTGALRAFFETFNLFLPAKQRISPAIIRQAIGAAVKDVRSEKTIVKKKKRMALIYKDFSIADLERYFQFYSSPEGEWINSLYVKGSGKAFERCLEKAAMDLSAAFNLQNQNV